MGDHCFCFIALARRLGFCQSKKRRWRPLNPSAHKRFPGTRINVHFAKKVNKVIPLQYENTFTSSDTSLNRKQTLQVPEVPSDDSFLEEDMDEFVSSFVERAIGRAATTLAMDLGATTITLWVPLFKWSCPT